MHKFNLTALFWILPILLFGRSFDLIDQHALNTPASAETSIEALAQYLTAPAQNDSDKIRAIFRWVTANITYDTSVYFTGSPGTHKPRTGNILQDRMALCEGYSTLMEGLGKAAGLKTVKISGHAKGVGYQIGDKITGPPDHAWNAVYLGGHWQLLDATWGSGHMDEGGKFVRQFEPFYFLTSPLDLIYTHFPEDPQWQLLEPQVTLAEFESFPFIKSVFHRYKLEMVNFYDGTIELNDSTIIAINNPENAQVNAILIQTGRELDRSLTFVQQYKDQIHIRIAPPRPDQYTLRIFAKAADDPGEYQMAMDYLIRYFGTINRTAGFPEVFKAFMDHNAYLNRPFQRTLKKGSTEIFDLFIPGALNAQIIQGDQWTPMLQSGDHFAQQVKITKNKVMIGAQFSKGGSYNILLKYEVR